MKQQNYLPGNIRERLQDLMKQHKLTQAELSKRIDIAESTISRFICGKTDKLGDENIVKIANEFNVSTDFLLGVVDEPERKNYDISELGLSAAAAKNLYTGKVNTKVLNLLLTNPHFAEATYLISRYLNEEMARGLAAQNQVYNSVAEMVSGNAQVVHDIKSLKTPIYQADISAIQKQFITAVKEIKTGTTVADSKQFTKEIASNMFAELTKGQDVRKCKITFRDIWRAVKNTVLNICGNTKETRKCFNQQVMLSAGGDEDEKS